MENKSTSVLLKEMDTQSEQIITPGRAFRSILYSEQKSEYKLPSQIFALGPNKDGSYTLSYSNGYEIGKLSFEKGKKSDDDIFTEKANWYSQEEIEEMENRGVVLSPEEKECIIEHYYIDLEGGYQAHIVYNDEDMVPDSLKQD